MLGKIQPGNFATALPFPMLMKTFRHCFLTLVVAVLLIGCAATGDPANDDADPLESYNRAMFAFNEAADRAIFKPVAQAYQAVLPDPVIASVGNFFSNINDVIVLVNDTVITSVTDFQQQLAAFRPGQRVSLTINRDQELKLMELRIP